MVGHLDHGARAQAAARERGHQFQAPAATSVALSARTSRADPAPTALLPYAHPAATLELTSNPTPGGPVDDINRQNRRGTIGCFVLAILIAAAVIAFLVWAWNQPGSDTPSYWH